MEDIVLYHGSRGGIEGKIAPISRERCDFGKGFYMGTNPEQAQSLVINDAFPVFYTLNLRLSEIPEERIFVPNEKEWLYIVLAHRKQIESFANLEISKHYRKLLKNYDIIAGPISDDRMKYAMSAFANGALTTEGLSACLRFVDYGMQYVALTDFACSKIDIISERNIEHAEAKSIQAYSEKKREEGQSIVQKMIREYRGKGLYIDEIIEQELTNKREEHER